MSVSKAVAMETLDTLLEKDNRGLKCVRNHIGVDPFVVKTVQVVRVHFKFLQPNKTSVKRSTFALNIRSSAYIAKEGRGYWALTLDEKKIRDDQKHSSAQDILEVS